MNLWWAFSVFFCWAMACLFERATVDVLLSRLPIAAWYASQETAKIHRFKCLFGRPCASRLNKSVRLLGWPCARWSVMASFRFRQMSSKCFFMCPSTHWVERKSGTCASSSWSKTSRNSAKLLQVETFVKHLMSSESSGESVVTGTVTDFEIGRTLGNRHVCPAYSMTITLRLSGVVMLTP